MAVDTKLLDDLGLSKGSPPMGVGQLRRRITNYVDKMWPKLYQDRAPDDFKAWTEGMLPTVQAAELALVFNGRLARARQAQQRLDRYAVSAGRPEVVASVETGARDSDGNLMFEDAVISEAVEALPGTIDRPTFDETGAVTGSETVPNPAIVQDEAERVAAQAVLSAMPQEVLDFMSGV